MHIWGAFAVLVVAFGSLCVVQVAVGKLQTPGTGRQQTHLVVLVHGLMGNARDLEYLALKLEEKGAVVLQSRKNEYMQSLAGIKEGAERLVEEIHEISLANPHLNSVSFVGNSLGGLFSRYAVKLLSIMAEEDKNATDFYLTTETGADMGMRLYPNRFMTIASPHLGVLDHVWAQDLLQDLFRRDHIWFPDWLKYLISGTMLRSGKELFLNGDGKLGKKNVTDSLVYKMATEERWLAPLRHFKKRRLYANLEADFVVPLSTAAFLEREEVREIRIGSKKAKSNKGDVDVESGSSRGVIVQEIQTSEKEDGRIEHVWKQSDGSIDKIVTESSCRAPSSSLDGSGRGWAPFSPREHMYCTMRSRLNSLGWEKFVVAFPGSMMSTHNKLAAVRRDPEWLFNGVLGFHAGDPIMDHAAHFLTSHDSEEQEE
jgi:hypothetical protein